MTQISEHVYTCHIDDTHHMHPGGTNIYFIGDPSEEMLILDTGEHDRSWTRQILEYWEGLGSPKITGILLSHGHGDHMGGVDRVQEATGAPVRCHPKLVEKLIPYLGTEWVTKLRSRERIAAGGGAVLEARFTPGHAEDHACYFLNAEKIALTGDTILGSSTSVVQDLASYMKSLALIERFKPRVICPAHGKIVHKAPEWVAGYIKHRNLRERQVLGALREGLGDADEIVRRIYPKNLKKALRHAAAGNVRQHLAKLKKDGLIEEVPARYVVAG